MKKTNKIGFNQHNHKKGGKTKTMQNYSAVRKLAKKHLKPNCH